MSVTVAKSIRSPGCTATRSFSQAGVALEKGTLLSRMKQNEHLLPSLTKYYFVTIGQTSGCLIVIDLNSNGEESVSILPCLVRLDG